MYVFTLNLKEFKSCPNETSVIRFARQSNPTMIDRSFNFFSVKEELRSTHSEYISKRSVKIASLCILIFNFFIESKWLLLNLGVSLGTLLIVTSSILNDHLAIRKLSSRHLLGQTKLSSVFLLHPFMHEGNTLMPTRWPNYRIKLSSFESTRF